MAALVETDAVVGAESDRGLRLAHGRRGTVDEDDGGFEAWFDHVLPVVRRVARRLSASEAEAEDLVAEALARAYASWREVAPMPYREGWVLRTATNLACDQARRRRRRERLRILPGSTSSSSLEDAVVDRRLLLDQLRKLPTRQREAVVLRYLADLPASEVALAMGLSDETIKTHLDRGLAHLRSALAIDQGVDLGVH